MRNSHASGTKPENKSASRPRHKSRLRFDRLEARLALASTPSLSINDVAVTESNSGTVQATFTVSLSPAAKKTVSVNYATANGTAVAGADYTSTNGVLTFERGETSKTISVPILVDQLDEPNETFIVKLSAAINATIAKPQGQGTIVDDDPAPTLSIGDTSLTEGNSQTAAIFTVSLSARSGQVVSVGYMTADGTAKSGSDYTSASGNLTFNPGQTTQTVSVPIVGDTLDEANEAFFVNLSGPTNATIAKPQGRATIVDDDPAPSLSIDSQSKLEGNSGTSGLVFTVSLSAPSGQTVSVGYATADGSAKSGGDYTASSGTVTFAPGSTSQTVTVSILGDTTYEPDETFSVNLSGAVNATIASRLGTGTIRNDDAAPVPAIVIGDATVTEGDTGSINAVFTVTLSTASAQVVTVGYATTNGTAVAGSDYTATTGVLTFNPGQTSQTIAVPVLGERVYESTESFAVNIGNPVNATIADSQGVGTIIDNDLAPVVAIDDASILEGNSGTTNLVFRVYLSNPSSSVEWAVVSTSNGTATAGSDYTARSGGGVTFLAGETALTISIPILGDTVVEPDETFFVNLTSASRAIADNQAVGTILNDDGLSMGPTSNLALTGGSHRAGKVEQDLGNVPEFPIALGTIAAKKQTRAGHPGLDVSFES